jgi:glucokinase
MKKKYAIGSDIGGSHISCAIIDLEKETILKHTLASQKVDNQASASEILVTWNTALRESLMQIDKNQVAGIGFAMPGPFEYDKGIARFTHDVAKYEKLNGINVASKIKELLDLPDDSEARFMNDASSFGVGEAWVGKASTAKRSVSITLGTGFGSAFIDNGVPVVERDDVPKMGCLWHLPFINGIADDYFSTRWFIRRYSEKTGHNADGVKEIADKFLLDTHDKDVFVEFGLNLGNFLSPWLKKFNADVLVIGGNVSAAFNLFGPFMERVLREQSVNAVIKISELKEDAALIGAARLFDNDFWEKVKPLLSKM